MSIKSQIKYAVIFSGVGLLAVLYFMYLKINDFLINQEVSKARLLADTIIDFRHYLSTVAPHVKTENVYPFACTPAYTVNQVAKIIKNQKHYLLRQVSDRPRNPKDKPNFFELKAIEFFKKHKEKEFWQIHEPHPGSSLIEKSPHIFYVKPLYVEKSCLKCHGEPNKDVPPKLYKLIVKYYGNKAFNYRIGDLRGIISIVIPFSNVQNEIFEVFRVLALIILLGYLIGAFVFWKITMHIEKSIEEIIRFFKEKVEHGKYESLNSKFKLEEFEILREEINGTINKIASYQQELYKKLYFNPLTELPNRVKFFEDHKNEIVVVLDIDKFKDINMFFGFKIADKLILEIVKRLKELSNKYNFKIYHIDIDKFVLLFDDKITIEELKNRLENLIKVLEKPYIIDDNEIMIKVRVGVSYYKKDYLRAEVAQEKAKELRRDIVFGSEIIEDKDQYKNNLKWFKKLKIALENDKIVPFYQPIVDKNKNIVKYEALVRMIDEDGKVISPFFFLEVAKKTRNYFEITKRIIQKSFEKFNNKDIGVSINLDLHDIESIEIREFIVRMLHSFNVKATFEVVESEDVRNSTDLRGFLKILQKNGAEIYIDDFGSGYANFDYLLKLSPNGVKIDGSLIKDILTNKNNELIVQSIIDFAHKVEMKVVAEFVENEEIFEKLKEMGVDYYQGYYFSPPLPDIKEN